MVGGSGINLLQDSIEGGQTGRDIIGTGPAVQVVGPSTDLESGVFIRCPAANSGNLFVGFNSSITADGGDATSGMIVEPGFDLPVPARKLSELWFAASAASTKFFWMAQ